MGISGRRIGHGGGGRRAHLEQGLLLARVRLEVEHLVNDDAEVEEAVGHNRDEWELAMEGAVNERGLSVGVFGGGATVVCGTHSEDQGSVDHVRSEEGDPRHERHRDAGKNSVYSLHPSRTQAFLLRDKRSPELHELETCPWVFWHSWFS